MCGNGHTAMASSVASGACISYCEPLDADSPWPMLGNVANSGCKSLLLGIKYKINLGELAVVLCGR